MIRTLVILAVVSFVLSIGCLAAALAIAGGPFYIDQDLRYHRDGWDIDISAKATPGGPASRSAGFQSALV
jgi:hypothetical protein